MQDEGFGVLTVIIDICLAFKPRCKLNSSEGSTRTGSKSLLASKLADFFSVSSLCASIVWFGGKGFD